MPKREQEEKQKEKQQSAFSLVKETLSYFLPMAWRYRKSYFFLYAVKTLVQALQPFAGILMMPLLIDGLLGGKEVKQLALYAAALVLGEVLLSVTNSILGVQLEKYDDLFQNYVSQQIGQRIMELDFQLTEDKKALDQLEKARTGMSWYSGGIHGLATPFFNMISYVIQILGVVVLLILNAPLLLGVTVVLLFFSTLIRSKQNKLEIENFKTLSKRNRIFSYVLFELGEFRFGKDIRLYGAKDMMLRKAEDSIDDMNRQWKHQADASFPYAMCEILPNIARDTVTYFYLGMLVITGKITIGVFSQMLTAGSTFHNSMNNVIWGVQQIIQRSNYAYEYVKFMNYPAAMHKGSRKVAPVSGESDVAGGHTLEFRHVSFTYPNTEVKVLNDVSITLRPGEHLSVVGLNGAGKTTFIKLLCRLYDVDSGEILLDGINIKDYDYEEYMQLFSVVFQDFSLLAFSMKENIVLDQEDSDENIQKIIQMAGLEEKVNGLPDGMHTMIFRQFDENGIEPSGGEQQKLAIARALYKDAPVVILDEPTAALDPVAEYEIYRQFNTLVGGKTAVYISHRLSSCKFCDRIAVFSEGTIKELGTHEELVALEHGVYAEMFQAQAQYYQ